MAGKLELFELSLKRGLEHSEEPWNESDWNDMNNRLDALNGSSGMGSSNFLTNFGLAAAALTGAVVFLMNPSADNSSNCDLQKPFSTEETMNHTEGEAHNLDWSAAEMSSTESHTTGTAEEINPNNESLEIGGLVVEESDSDMDETSLSEIDLDADVDSNLSAKEVDRMLSINDRLQNAADRKPNDSSEKKITTRYVGKDFDLGALRTFSPNNDGFKDVFMPSTIKENDKFLLSISDQAGKNVYKTSNVKKPWDGSDSAGKELPVGHYSWEVTIQKGSKKEIFRGVVRLER